MADESIGIEHVFEQMLQQLGDHHVEFQLPESFMKDKSMTFTSIKRNVYLMKRPKKRTDDDGFCTCSSSETSQTCGADCLCWMLLSTCSSSCKCGDSCGNKPFHLRPVKKMKLVKTEKCGAGILAEEDIKRGDFIVEYVGEVIDDKTCEDRLWKMRHCGETNFYLCEINRDMVIDATYKGNKSRFINHSCQPNTEMQKWTTEGETRIGIFASRDIKIGEELAYDYQFVQFGADQDCYCGAEGCRQKLGSKPSKPKYSPSDAALQLVLCEMATSSHNEFPNGVTDIGFSHFSCKKKTLSQNCIWEAIRIWCPQDKRYYGGTIVEFDCYSGTHTIVREDGEVKTLDISEGDWELLPV